MAFQTNPRSILYGFPKENILGTTILFFIVKVVDPIIQNLCTMFKKKKIERGTRKKIWSLMTSCLKMLATQLFALLTLTLLMGLKSLHNPLKALFDIYLESLLYFFFWEPHFLIFLMNLYTNEFFIRLNVTIEMCPS